MRKPSASPKHKAPDVLFLGNVIGLMDAWTIECGGNKQAAEVAGGCYSYWYGVRNGFCMPGPKILRALDLDREWQYRQSGQE